MFRILLIKVIINSIIFSINYIINNYSFYFFDLINFLLMLIKFIIIKLINKVIVK